MKNIRAVLNEVKGENAHKQAIQMGLKYKGFGYWVDPSTGEVTHKTENDQLVEVEPEMEAEKAGKDAEGAGAPSGTFGNTEGGLGASFQTHKNKQNPTGLGTNVLDAPDPGKETPNPDSGRWEPGADGDNMVPGKGQEKEERNKPPKDAFVGKTNYYQWTAGPDGDSYKTLSFADMLAKVTSAEVPVMEEAEQSDANRLKIMNDSIKSLVANPDYDMSKKGEELGSGMHGSVYDSLDGNNVIKEGDVSLKEIAILSKLQKQKAFPNLVNAELKSLHRNNYDKHAAGEGREPSPYYGDELFHQKPLAKGTIAMSKAMGQPYRLLKNNMKQKDTEKLMQKLWSSRSEMHKLGISHNDLRDENFFVDDAGNPTILDFGLANDDPLSALMEALSGYSGEDTQTEEDAVMGKLGNFVPQALRGRFGENVGNLRQNLIDRMIQNNEDEMSEEDVEDLKGRVQNIMRGRSRMTDEDLSNMREEFGIFKDNDTVLELIKDLYKNVTHTETAQRMSNAYDILKNDRKKIALNNLLRRQEDMPQIQDNLAKHLEPDD